MTTADVQTAGLRRLPRLVCYLTAGWAGAAVMAFELAATRLLMPSFGMGIEVWSAVIATTLGFLAIGYVIGGRLADARPRPGTLAVSLLLAGWSLLLIRALAPAVPDWSNSCCRSFIAAAWCSAALILAAPLLMLGAVQPTLARLMIRESTRAGRVVGGLLAAGTVGSVAGTAMTGLVLIPQVGTAMTLLILGAGTVVMSTLVLVAARQWVTALVCLILTAPVILAAWRWRYVHEPAGPMQVLEQVEGMYGYLEVLDYRGVRTLACNGIFQTAIPLGGLGMSPGTLIRAHDYTELIPCFRPATRDVLLIGLGGGLHAQALACHDLDVHAVEIDPAVVRLAERYFGLFADVTVADGRSFLARDTNVYDAIVLDTFLGGTMPEHLYTVEAFADAARRLVPEGILVIHLIGRPQHAATKAVAHTLEAVFPQLRAARSGFADELQHVYLFASRKPMELLPDELSDLEQLGFTGQEWFDIDTEDAPVLTDDRTNLALLNRELVTRHRNLCLLQRRSPPW